MLKNITHFKPSFKIIMFPVWDGDFAILNSLEVLIRIWREKKDIVNILL